MLAPNKIQPAGRVSKSARIAAVQHDELLQWTIRRLETLMRELVEPHAFEIEAALAGARSLTANLAVAELSKQLDEIQRATKNGGVLQAVAAAHGRTEAIRKACFAVSAATLPDPIESIAFEVQRPVEMPRLTASGHTNNKLAGFVDLAVEVTLREAPRVEIGNLTAGDTPVDPFRCADAAQTISQITQFSPDKVHAKFSRSSKHLMYLTVRPDSFTLSEVLQELKTLRRLLPGQQAVAVVVDGIAHELRRQLEQHGFIVIDRQDPLGAANER